MPRGSRLDPPAMILPVLVRGIECRPLFLDEEDRERFVRRVTLVLAATGARCFAFALMSNHYHLLLRPRVVSLSRVLRRPGAGP